jgi:biopolymer transport protein ExbB/biopolymer transport protein TolQ
VNVFDLMSRMTLFPWLVVLLLAGMNVLTLTVAVLKWWQLRRMRQANRALGPAFGRALEEDRIDDAIALAREHSTSPIGRVLGEALERTAPLLANAEFADRAIESAERTVARQQLAIASEVKRHLSALATIGATAPFVGLLGTTIGITNSFIGIATTGGGGIEAVAGGVGEALITTAVGLLVAIPALWLYNYFITRLEELFAELAFASDELLEWLSLRHAGVGFRYDAPVTAGQGA